MLASLMEGLGSLDPARKGPVNHFPITHVPSGLEADRRFAHLIRRVFHFSACAAAPLIFYFGWIPLYEESAAEVSPWLETNTILVALAALAVSWDIGVRLVLKGKFLNWGQREYERHQVSAQVQAGVGVFLTFLLAPRCAAGGASAGCSLADGAKFGAPAIWTLALMDPLIGVVKEFRVPPVLRLLLASLFAFCAWGVGVVALGTPLELVPVVAIVAAIVEFPALAHADDNMLIPLTQTLVIRLLLAQGWGDSSWGGGWAAASADSPHGEL